MTYLNSQEGRRFVTMEGITLLIAVAALVLAILAYQRSGGTVDLKRQIESTPSSADVKKQMESLMAMTDALREKAADALDRMEKVVRKTDKVE
jgi:high-affinity Fe2+/Pb2+ permease